MSFKIVRTLGTQIQFGKGGKHNPEVPDSYAILKKRFNIFNYTDVLETVIFCQFFLKP